MNILGDFSLELTRWLQNNYPQLEPFFRTITQAGQFEFYLVVISLTYWCIHKRLGRAMSYLVALTAVLNTVIKHLFRDQRPFWSDPALALVHEESYGIPSGHSQFATVFYSLVATFIRRGWAWLVAAIVIFLMAASRVYLGVHDIEDVVAGIILGLIVLVGYALWNRYLVDRFNNRILGQRLLIAVLAPTVLIIIYAAGLLLVDAPDRPPAFDAFVDTAEMRSWEDSSTAIGLFFGFSIGFVMEMSRVRFMVDGSLGRRALRYLVGIAGTLIIWKGLGVLFPPGPLALVVPLNFVRYGLVALWVSYYAPWVFVRLKLADARPEPEVSLTL